VKENSNTNVGREKSGGRNRKPVSALILNRSVGGRPGNCGRVGLLFPAQDGGGLLSGMGTIRLFSLGVRRAQGKECKSVSDRVVHPCTIVKEMGRTRSWSRLKILVKNPLEGRMARGMSSWGHNTGGPLGRFGLGPCLRASSIGGGEKGQNLSWSTPGLSREKIWSVESACLASVSAELGRLSKRVQPFFQLRCRSEV